VNSKFSSSGKEFPRNQYTWMNVIQGNVVVLRLAMIAIFSHVDEADLVYCHETKKMPFYIAELKLYELQLGDRATEP